MKSRQSSEDRSRSLGATNSRTRSKSTPSTTTASRDNSNATSSDRSRNCLRKLRKTFEFCCTTKFWGSRKKARREHCTFDDCSEREFVQLAIPQAFLLGNEQKCGCEDAACFVDNSEHLHTTDSKVSCARDESISANSSRNASNFNNASKYSNDYMFDFKNLDCFSVVVKHHDAADGREEISAHSLNTRDAHDKSQSEETNPIHEKFTTNSSKIRPPNESSPQNRDVEDSFLVENISGTSSHNASSKKIEFSWLRSGLRRHRSSLSNLRLSPVFDKENLGTSTYVDEKPSPVLQAIEIEDVEAARTEMVSNTSWLQVQFDCVYVLCVIMWGGKVLCYTQTKRGTKFVCGHF